MQGISEPFPRLQPWFCSSGSPAPPTESRESWDSQLIHTVRPQEANQHLLQILHRGGSRIVVNLETHWSSWFRSYVAMIALVGSSLLNGNPMSQWLDQASGCSSKPVRPLASDWDPPGTFRTAARITQFITGRIGSASPGRGGTTCVEFQKHSPLSLAR